jgi:hypothetical protein
MRYAIPLCIIALAFTPSYTAAQDGKAIALETLGATTGMSLYNTYITIGSMADQYGCACIEDTLAIQIADEQIGAIDDLISHFNDLLSSGYIDDPADVSFLNESIAAFNMLRAQAVALIDYINYGEDYYADIFDEKRNAAWDMISSLLGFED